MGTIPEQPLTLICSFEEFRFYIVSMDVSELSILSVKADLDWAMIVAFHHGKMEAIKGTSYYDRYAEMSAANDVVKGPIADDRMFYVLDNFFAGNITDAALVSSLSALKLGEQYVAVTGKACEKIRIEREVPLSWLEKRALREYGRGQSPSRRLHGEHICKKYRREGLFFDEILDQAGKENG